MSEPPKKPPIWVPGVSGPEPERQKSPLEELSEKASGAELVRRVAEWKAKYGSLPTIQEAIELHRRHLESGSDDSVRRDVERAITQVSDNLSRQLAAPPPNEPPSPPPPPPGGMPPSGTPTSEPSDQSGRKFDIKVILWGAIPVAVFGVGLQDALAHGFSSASIPGAVLALLGLAGVALLTLHLTGRKVLPGFPVYMGALLALTLVLSGYEIWDNENTKSKIAHAVRPPPSSTLGPVIDLLTGQLANLRIELHDSAQVRDELTKQIGNLQSQLSAIAKDRDATKHDRDDKISQLNTANDALATAQRAIEQLQKSQEQTKPPGGVAIYDSASGMIRIFIPTHVRLLFHAVGNKPEELSATNAHWSSWSFYQKVGIHCGDDIISSVYPPPKCMETPPHGDKTDIEREAVIIAIVFDHPVVYKSITADFHNENYNWQILDSNDRFAIIIIYPNPAKVDVDFVVNP